MLDLTDFNTPGLVPPIKIISADLKLRQKSLPQIKEEENVTQKLLKIWKSNRKQFRIKTVKETPAEINRRMRMKFLPKIDAVTPYETIGLEKFHMDFERIKLGPRRRKKYEFKPLPSLAEIEAERIRTDKIIENMLRPHIEKYERQQEEMQKNHHKYYTTLQEIMVRF